MVIADTFPPPVLAGSGSTGPLSHLSRVAHGHPEVSVTLLPLWGKFKPLLQCGRDRLVQDVLYERHRMISLDCSNK